MQKLPKGDNTNPICAAFPYHKQRLRVLGGELACADDDEGDPIVLLHGNPTPSYVWRNVLPYLEQLGRCTAPNLAGMGDSDKLPDSATRPRSADQQAVVAATLPAAESMELPNRSPCTSSDSTFSAQD